MKKSLRSMSFILALIFMIFTTVSSVNADTYYNTDLIHNAVSIKIGGNNALINGAFKGIDSTNPDVKPYISEDRTMVPVRFVSEAFGATVYYDSKNKAVTITLGNQIIVLTIGNKTMVVNGIAVEMDVAATITNERTYIPLAYVAEGLGMNKFYLDGLIIISPQSVTVNQVADAETISFLSSQLVNQSQQVAPTPTQTPTQTQVQVPYIPQTYPTETYRATVQKIVAIPVTKTIEGPKETSSEVIVTAYYSNGATTNVTKECQFKSDDEDIAYVSSAYKLQSGNNDGKVDITVTYKYYGQEVKDTITVIVDDVTLERIVATPTKYFFDELDDEGDEITVTAYYSDGSTKDVTEDCDFDSEDEDVAYIDDDDYTLCSGDDEGEIEITVTYEEDDEECEDTITVEVEEDAINNVALDKIVATPSSEDFDKLDDEGSDVKVIAYYSDGRTQDVTEDCNFESEDIDVAYVTADCELHSGDDEGEVEITVTYEENGEEEEVIIAVEVKGDNDDGDDDVTLEKIVATPTKYFFDELDDEGDEIKVTAYYSDGSSEDVTEDCDFDSEDEDVAYVDDDEYTLCSGDDEGEVEITVTYEEDDEECEDTITVEVEEDGDNDVILEKIVATPSSEDFDELDDEGGEIEVIAYYSDGSKKDVTEDCNFETEDIDVVYVTADFELHSGDDEGEVEITITYVENGEEEEDTITVEVQED